VGVILQSFRRRLGRIGECSTEDFRQAGLEVLVVCLSAFIPLWAGMGIFSLTRTPGAVSTYALSVMTSGEMLLIACAIIGPLIYILTRKYGNLRDPLTLRFPYSTGLSIIILVIWFASGGVFVVNKLGGLYSSPNIFDETAMWDLSEGISIAAVAILFLATVLRNYMDRMDAGALMHADQEEFVRDFTNG
jgi:hypothetical protein